MSAHTPGLIYACDDHKGVALCPLHQAAPQMFAELQRLAELLGSLPENGRGSLQGFDVNRAFARISALVAAIIV